MPDFAAALKVKASDVEPPKQAPLGTYLWEVSGVEYDKIESDKGKWNVINFQMQARDVFRDENDLTTVDEDALKEFGGVKLLRRRNTFMFPLGDEPEDVASFERTLFYMTEFLTKHLGLDAGEEIDALIAQAKGNFCIADLVSRPDKSKKNPDGSPVTYIEIGRTAPVKG